MWDSKSCATYTFYFVLKNIVAVKSDFLFGLLHFLNQEIEEIQAGIGSGDFIFSGGVEKYDFILSVIDYLFLESFIIQSFQVAFFIRIEWFRFIWNF